MRILFALRHTSYLRNFLGVIDELIHNGHQIHFVFDVPGPLGEDKLFQSLCERYPGVTGEMREINKRSINHVLSRTLRSAADCFRYFEPEFAHATALRDRALDKSPFLARFFATVVLRRWPKLAARMQIPFAFLEWGLRVAPDITRIIDQQRPDLVLVTPLLGVGSDQVDWLRAAKLAGIPTVLPVTSWDNLTNKGRIRIHPDHTIVWNPEQKREYLAHHSGKSENIEVCGAWTYDHWFSWRPSTTRNQLLEQVGLKPCKDYLLYVGSSPFITRTDEAKFAMRLFRAMQENPVLADIGILIRPHPQNASQWDTVNLRPFNNIAVYPRGGSNPIDTERRNKYFDCMWHSSAVFGINTSAQIEAAIIDRPVFTITAQEFRETQEGTLHFHHLTGVNGGALFVSGDADEFCTQLAHVMSLPPDERSSRSRRFVDGFIRPFGKDVAGVGRAVQAIENAVGRKSEEVSAMRIALARLSFILLFPLFITMISEFSLTTFLRVIVKRIKHMFIFIRSLVSPS